MIGTSDQSCWLAEACQTLLLLLLHLQFKGKMPAGVCISDMYSHQEIKHISDSIGHHIVSVVQECLV